MSSPFPKQLQHDGLVWHLLYDPADAGTVQPSLAGSKVVNTSCDQVKVPNNNATLFMVTVDLLFPAMVGANGRMSSERRLKAFRIYQTAPASLDAVRPEEMVYYIASPVSNGGVNAGQNFLNALLGLQVDGSSQQVDSGWSQLLSPPQPSDQTTMSIQSAV